MALPIYVTSTQNFSGKSAVCVALLKHFQKEGRRVGYMKPLSTTSRMMGEKAIDEDARFVKEVFDLAEELDVLSPVMLTDVLFAKVLAGEENDFEGQVKSALGIVSQDKDIVVLEGGANLREGSVVNLSPAQLSGKLGARILVVIGYHDDLQVVDDILVAKMRLGEEMVGAVINSVPKHHMPFVQKEMLPFIKEKGIDVLAVLQKEAVLQSISIGEIADLLEADMVCGQDQKEALVENLMVSAMSVDNALTYFRRKMNKGVITGGDRPDIQLAALETSTKALILTGNLYPSPMIIGRAQERGVAIIISRYDTLSTVETIEKCYGKTRFHQQQKVDRFVDIFEERMDFARFYEQLGLE